MEIHLDLNAPEITVQRAGAGIVLRLTEHSYHDDADAATFLELGDAAALAFSLLDLTPAAFESADIISNFRTFARLLADTDATMVPRTVGTTLAMVLVVLGEIANEAEKLHDRISVELESEEIARDKAHDETAHCRAAQA